MRKRVAGLLLATADATVLMDEIHRAGGQAWTIGTVEPGTAGRIEVDGRLRRP